MEFVDLKTQQARIYDALQTRINTVLAHGNYIMGPEIAELERGLSTFCGAAHALTCASGTDALLLPLMAWGVGPGDAVFVPGFTFFATAEMPALLGATPVFVDVDPHTRNMDPAALEAAIARIKNQDTLRPRVVITVDLFGLPCDYPAITDIARRHNLLVLEDAAQAFGSERNGKKACASGCHAATTSFFPAKPLGCYGDGGAVFTENSKLAATLESLRVHGKGADKYDNRLIGINGRMDTLQAAILLPKLAIFADELEARQQVARWYDALLPIELERPRIPEGARSSWAQYTILLPRTESAPARRDHIQALLRARAIPSNVYYPTPQHCLSVFAPLGYAPQDLPVALDLSCRILALPMHPYLDQAQVAEVCAALAEALHETV